MNKFCSDPNWCQHRVSLLGLMVLLQIHIGVREICISPSCLCAGLDCANVSKEMQCAGKLQSWLCLREAHSLPKTHGVQGHVETRSSSTRLQHVSPSEPGLLCRAMHAEW